MKKEYIITCSNETSIDKIIEQIYLPNVYPEGVESLSGFNPVTDYMPYSENQVIFRLTEKQAEQLKNNSLIIDITEKIDLKAELFNNVYKNQKRDISASAIYNNTNSTSHTNWGFARCMSLSGARPWFNDFTYYYTGSGVDVVIIDSGIIPNHPEFGPLGRFKPLNWSLYHPITSNNELSVSVIIDNGQPKFVIDGVTQNTVYVPSSAAYPTRYRTSIYKFNLDGTSTLNYPFFIGSGVNVNDRYTSVYVSRNGATTGTVTLTVFDGITNLPTTGKNRDTMYYFNSGNSSMGGIITKTEYNTQSEDTFFYSDSNGHGTHCTGTAAGSSYGWAPNANIYCIKMGFYDDYGFPNNTTGYIKAYNLLKNWHSEKVNSNFRPTVVNNSYGWGIGFPLSDINLAVKSLIDAGVHFVHSAGNSYGLIVRPIDPEFNQYRLVYGESGNYYALCRESSPCYPINSWTTQETNPVITVGALGGNFVNNPNLKADYSNYGKGISIYAPGTVIMSTWNNTSFATYPGNASFGIRKLNGTSMAGPQVVGVLATILEKYPNLTPLSAKNLLLQNSIVGAISSNDNFYSNSLQYYSLCGGNNLTLSQYPATYIAVPARPYSYSNWQSVNYNDNCYYKLSDISLNGLNFISNLMYMNSSSDLSYSLNICPS